MCSHAQKTDRSDLDKLSKKISQFGKLKIIDSALFYSNELLSKSKAIQDTSYELKAYNDLAKYYKLINSQFQSVKYYTKAKELYLIIGDTNTAIKKLRRIAIAQNSLGDYNSSENMAIEGLKLTIGLPDSLALKQKLGLYNSLGIATKRLKNYDDAIIWYNRALKISIDSLKVITLKNNIAVINIQQKKFQLVIDSLSKLVKLPILEKDIKVKLRVMDNLGFAKSKLNYPEAEKELLQVLRIRQKIKDISGQFSSTIHLVKHYQDNKQNRTAIYYAKNAYEIATKMGWATSKVEALSYLIDLKKNPKNEAIEYKNLTDSITTARQQAKNQFAKIKYETDQYREENLKIKEQNAQQQVVLQKQKNQRIVLISLISLLSIGIGFVFYYWKQRNKIERIQERHTTEKRISKKLHDEVGNDIFYLATQLQQDPGFTTDPDKLKILKGFDSVYHKVRDISRDHTVETGEEYGDEVLSLLNSYGSQTTKVVTNTLDADFWSSVSAYKKGELYWVLKELLTNMKKHSKASFVSVQFLKEKQRLIVTYVDNGIGITDKHLISKNGLRNVENRMKDIKGTIIFESEPKQGFKAKIVFTS
ncbi:hypothetical protein ATO12_02935 [Aquimarina atlantica]|uniref:histidine kinase n=1 Tax=Aquimarina atlantica TaxID=1317122 RepID=A0A023C1D9_9FLAO|nr:hypothetical protein ATO12_02935 [Aquimarina atlantica]